MQELKAAVKEAAKQLFKAEIEPEINRPLPQFGDYATNAALQLAKKMAATPRQVAEQLVTELQTLTAVTEVSIAGPGFINFKLTNQALAQAVNQATDLPRPLTGQEILVEFGDPNPFKEMHIGHLYSYIVGDAIASLLETRGASVKRLSYHGDVGLHVAKAIWDMKKEGFYEGELQLEDKVMQSMLSQMGHHYQMGNQAYETDETARSEIDSINRHIYQKDDPAINKLHELGTKYSFDFFDNILSSLGITTDKRYLESQATAPGLELVKANLGKVFKDSQGAVIFEGEKAGLHTRVFITSKGLPTYETKDLGLVVLKDRDFPDAARSIVITANEQSEYFKVMLAALAQINQPLAQKTTHLTHGFVNLSTGKMSSRTGDVYGASNLLAEVKQATQDQYPDSKVQPAVSIGAIKYAFIKNRLGPDIVFDVKESINLEGNSGPYLQYAYARACSILAKVTDSAVKVKPDFDNSERALALKISEFPEVVEKSANDLLPHHIAIYLYELAQTFNSFYETSRIVGDDRQALRLELVKSYSQVLKRGLNILNIEAPERM